MCSINLIATLICFGGRSLIVAIFCHKLSISNFQYVNFRARNRKLILIAKERNNF